MPGQQVTLEYEGQLLSMNPDLGAIITSYKLDGKDVIYPLRSVGLPPKRRGGIPILFPNAGDLKDDFLEVSGTTLGRHGFARDNRWDVREQSASQVTLQLGASEKTRESYPFDFLLSYTVSLGGSGLSLKLDVTNLGKHDMPVAPGWHPYFPCEVDAKQSCAISINNLVVETIKHNEFDYGISLANDDVFSASIAGLGVIKFRVLGQLDFVQLWSLTDSNFVCVEPWCGPLDLLNSPKAPVVHSGESQSFEMQFELEQHKEPMR